jgi:hypothetical protein
VPVSGFLSKGDYVLDIGNLNFLTGNYYCELLVNGVYRKVIGFIVLR